MLTETIVFGFSAIWRATRQIQESSASLWLIKTDCLRSTELVSGGSFPWTPDMSIVSSTGTQSLDLVTFKFWTQDAMRSYPSAGWALFTISVQGARTVNFSSFRSIVWKPSIVGVFQCITCNHIWTMCDARSEFSMYNALFSFQASITLFYTAVNHRRPTVCCACSNNLMIMFNIFFIFHSPPSRLCRRWRIFAIHGQSMISPVWFHHRAIWVKMDRKVILERRYVHSTLTSLLCVYGLEPAQRNRKVGLWL